MAGGKKSRDRETLDLARAALLADCAEAKKTAGMPVRSSRRKSIWPLMCDTMGCMPEQVQEANANCRKMGRTDVTYHPDGTVELGSGRAMEWLAKQTDMHHRKGWF